MKAIKIRKAEDSSKNSLRSLCFLAVKFFTFFAVFFVVGVAVVPKPHLLDETSFSPCYVDRNG